ncbi:MAG: hypothetical protein JST16_03495 [Bdellovibrionales bacterium]|nr:hypothetical protein [Bdellovibrionales bacterium]
MKNTTLRIATTNSDYANGLIKRLEKLFKQDSAKEDCSERIEDFLFRNARSIDVNRIFESEIHDRLEKFTSRKPWRSKLIETVKRLSPRFWETLKQAWLKHELRGCNLMTVGQSGRFYWVSDIDSLVADAEIYGLIPIQVQNKV